MKKYSFEISKKLWLTGFFIESSAICQNKGKENEGDALMGEKAKQWKTREYFGVKLSDFLISKMRVAKKLQHVVGILKILCSMR